MISYRIIRRTCLCMISFILLLIIILIVTEKYRGHCYSPTSNLLPHHLLPIRMITYNIQAFPWLMKSLASLKEIVNDASIIVLQEYFNQFKRSDIQQHFPDYYMYRGKLSSVKVLNSGLMILSKFPIVTSSFTAFKNKNLYTLDAFSDKGYLSVLLKIGNREIYVITTHLQSSTHEEYDPVCFLQYQELIDYIRTLTKPFVLAGDFNVDVEECKKQFPFYKYHYPSTPTIYINFKKGHTQSTPQEGYYGRTLDYFITNKVECTPPNVIESTFSDHNPVETVISFE